MISLRFSILLSLFPMLSFAQWDTLTTISSYSFSQYPIIEDMEIFNNELYVVGNFDSIGGILADKIAKFDGQNWHSLPIYLDDYIRADLQVFQNELYILGKTGRVGLGVFDDEYITKWDGSAWSVLKDSALLFDNSNPSIFHKMEVHNNQLFIGGRINGNIDLPDENGLAIWDGSNFVSNGVDCIGEVRDMESNGNTLGICGQFRLDSGVQSVFAILDNGVYRSYYPQTINTGSNSIIHGATFSALTISNENLLKGGVWSYQQIKDASGSHLFIDSKLIFSFLGNIYQSDTSDLSNQVLVFDSIDFGSTIFTIYDGKMIVAPSAAQTINKAVILYKDTSVILNLKESSRSEKLISIYPNPSNGLLECKNCSKDLKVFNHLGQEIPFNIIEVNSGTEYTIELLEKQHGTYFLKDPRIGMAKKIIIY